MDHVLRARRGELERTWHAGVAEQGSAASARPEVYASWRRSSAAVAPEMVSAPVVAPEEVARRWSDSRLGRASRAVLDDLTDLAASGDMMAAITDESVTIAWIAGGRTMSRRADRVHFTLGGCWAEEAAGTNALAMAHQTGRAATIFSAEHYATMVHDWVCYSAPILDPDSGRFLGVLDLSMMWHRAHPSLLVTASALARCVEYELATAGRMEAGRMEPSRMEAGRMEPSRGAAGGRGSVPWAAAGMAPLVGADDPGGGGAGSGPGEGPGEGMVLRTLGSPAVRVDGIPLAVTPRQIELLTVLSLHPTGLGLGELVGRVYGDRPVSPSTVKAELSHLRHALGGWIGSRPYRLVGPVHTDHHATLQALVEGDVSTAVRLYRGSMLAASDSPDVTMWRNHIDVAVRDAVLRARQLDLLWELSSRCPDDIELHQVTLAALDRADTRCSIVAGRIAAAAG